MVTHAKVSNLCRILMSLKDLPFEGNKNKHSFSIRALQAQTDADLDLIIQDLKNDLSAIVAELETI